jgi:hypothetical protein
MKIGNYEFSLKRFEYLESRSDETPCFSAVLYVDGKPLANCGNNGCGGPNDIYIFPECRAMGEAFEAFLTTQPRVKPAGYDIELECDLDYIVDELVGLKLEERRLQKIKALTKNNLVFRTPGGEHFLVGWKNHSIEEMVKRPNGSKLIRDTIADHVAGGYTLVNGNIPAELLPKSSNSSDDDKS